jgi:hypothetical protein
MTKHYKKAERLLRRYDKARADLRLLEQELKAALREYSSEQGYGCNLGIDTFRATITTRERKAA